MSDVGRTTAPPQGAQTNAANAETTGRAHDITSTEHQGAALTANQREKIHTYFSRHPQAQGGLPIFTVSVGAAVPRQVALQNLPPELASALPDYRDHQFVRIGERLVIVEK